MLFATFGVHNCEDIRRISHLVMHGRAFNAAIFPRDCTDVAWEISVTEDRKGQIMTAIVESPSFVINYYLSHVSDMNAYSDNIMCFTGLTGNGIVFYRIAGK